MGQKNSKANQKKTNSGKMITKISTQGGPGSSTTGFSYLVTIYFYILLQNKLIPYFQTVKPAEHEEDLSVGAIEEGFVIPRRTENICGVFLETLVIASQMDDPMPRDMAIFHLFNYDSPEDVSEFQYLFLSINFQFQNMLAYIARPEVPKRDAKESFAAMMDVLLKVDQNLAEKLKAEQNQAEKAKVDQNQAEGCNFPTLIVAGRIKRVKFTMFI